MTDLTFAYSGRDLEPLLSQRLAEHVAALAACDEAVARFKPSQLESAKSSMLPRLGYDERGNIRSFTDTVTSEVQTAKHARDQAWIAKRETELWLLEAVRTPDTVWMLTLKDLGLLYPETHAVETLARIRAARSERRSSFYRLLALLAGFLARVSPTRRLPASST